MNHINATPKDSIRETDATLGVGVRFETTCTVSRKWNEDMGLVQDFIFSFCVWRKSRVLRGRVSQRFPCVNSAMESFSSNLLRAIISYWTESHLEYCQTSTMELFSKNSQQAKDVDYFHKNTSPHMFHWILNAPSFGEVL